MGPFVNRPITTLTLGCITALIVALNVFLIFDIAT
jgi:hypothetical protein